MQQPQFPIAWWSAASSFFATLLAVGAINIINPDDQLKFVSSLFVGFITGGAVYTRERLVEARGKHYDGILLWRTEKDGHTIIQLQFHDEEINFAKKHEILFKVDKRNNGVSKPKKIDIDSRNALE